MKWQVCRIHYIFPDVIEFFFGIILQLTTEKVVPYLITFPALYSYALCIVLTGSEAVQEATV